MKISQAKRPVDIILINPYKYYPGCNNPGLAYLEGFLTGRGFSCLRIDLNSAVEKSAATNAKTMEKFKEYFSMQCCDEECWDKDRVISYVNELAADSRLAALAEEMLPPDRTRVAALSLASRDQFIFTLFISLLFKHRGAAVVWGGPLVSRQGDEISRIVGQTKWVDHLIKGEGEMPLWKILSDNPDSPDRTNSIAPFASASSSLVSHETISSDPIFRPGETPYIYATKSCYWSRCAFCVLDDNRSYFDRRIRDANEVWQEVKRISARLEGSTRPFVFTDNALPPTFIKEFSRVILQESESVLHPRFHASVRFEPALDRETLKIARQAGFEFLAFGLETSSPRLLRLLDKGIVISEAERILENCYESGIKITLHFIIGLPTQTEAELRSDLEYMIKLVRKYPGLEPCVKDLRVHPGSLIYNDPAGYGIKLLSPRQTILPPYISYRPLAPGALSAEKARAIYRDFYYAHQELWPFPLANLYNFSRKKADII